MTIEITVLLKEDGRQKSLSALVNEVAERLRAKTDLSPQSIRLRGIKRFKRKLIIKYDGLAPVFERDESISPNQQYDDEHEKTEDNDFIGFMNDEESDTPLL